MAVLLHRLRDEGPFGEKIRQAEPEYLISSRAALAENYVGLAY
jgi:p-hydroxybenzoate 3-monooxygenase